MRQWGMANRTERPRVQIVDLHDREAQERFDAEVWLSATGPERIEAMAELVADWLRIHEQKPERLRGPARRVR